MFSSSSYAQGKEGDGYILFPKCEKLSDNELQSCNSYELTKFISHYLQYPEVALNKGYEGKVLVKYILTSEGKLEASVVKQDQVHPSLDNAALEVINKLKDSIDYGKIRIIPAKVDGKRVNSYYQLPIRFRLPDEGPKQRQEDTKRKIVLATYRTSEKSIQFRRDLDGNIYAYSLLPKKEEMLIKISGNTDPEFLTDQEKAYFFLYNLTFLKPEVLLTLGKIDGKEYEVYIDKHLEPDKDVGETSKMYISVYISGKLNEPVDVFSTVDQLFDSKYASLLFK